MNIDDFPTGKEFDDLTVTTRIKEIKETIVDLTDRLDTEEHLWEAYKAINKGLMYLSAKHTMLEVKNKD